MAIVDIWFDVALLTVQLVFLVFLSLQKLSEKTKSGFSFKGYLWPLMWATFVASFIVYLKVNLAFGTQISVFLSLFFQPLTRLSLKYKAILGYLHEIVWGCALWLSSYQLFLHAWWLCLGSIGFPLFFWLVLKPSNTILTSLISYGQRLVMLIAIYLLAEPSIAKTFQQVKPVATIKLESLLSLQTLLSLVVILTIILISFLFSYQKK